MATPYLGNTPNRTSGAATFSADTDYYHSWLAPAIVSINADIAALNTNDTRDTSTTSNSVGTGAKAFVVSASKSFSKGQWLTIADTTAPTVNSMVAQVSSYSGTTLNVDVPVNGVFGSGTKTAWTIALTAAPSFTISPSVRNVIINGACDIAQRAAVAVPAANSGYGGPDRFYVVNSVAGGQFTQAAATLTFGGEVKNSVRQTVNTATTAFTTTNHWGGIAQYIEGFNCYYLKDKPTVVSFIFNTNLTGTYSVSLRDGGGNYSYVATFSAVANTPIKVGIAIPVIPSAASIPRSNEAGLRLVVGFLNQATFQTATLNSWLTGNFLTASTQTVWAATAGNFIELTELQLEAGTVASPFERRSFGDELHLCLRYYEILAATYRSYVTGTAFAAVPMSFKARKRAAPTLFLGGTPSILNCTDSLRSNTSAPDEGFGYEITATTLNLDTYVFHRAISASAEL